MYVIFTKPLRALTCISDKGFKHDYFHDNVKDQLIEL